MDLIHIISQIWSISRQKFTDRKISIHLNKLKKTLSIRYRNLSNI